MGPGKTGTALPPMEDPIPTQVAPTKRDSLEQMKAEATRKQLKARAGRRGTILTEPGTLGEPLLQRQTLLGRV